ncbi:MAG: MarR family transcriptional regulator [Bacteroidetes bacterium]|nr:MarR family transcriptional regulator [Bacteroidota bacterium]
MSANDKVISALTKAGKPLKPGEIAEMAGIDKKEVEKAIKTLKAEGKIDSPVRCFYGIKK